MRLLVSLFFVLSIFFATPALAADCACQVNVEDSSDWVPSCTIDQLITLPIGVPIQTRQVFDYVSLSDCSVANLAKNFIPADQVFSIDAGACNGFIQNGTMEGYDYAISCIGEEGGSETTENPAAAGAAEVRACQCTVDNASTVNMSEFVSQEQCKNQTLSDGRVLTDCTWHETIQKQAAGEDSNSLFSGTLKSEIGGLNRFKGKNLPQVIGTMVKTAMGVMGTLALVIFIYGGITWMLARGNADKQREGFDTLVWGSLGIAVMLASYALVNYVFEAFR